MKAILIVVLCMSGFLLPAAWVGAQTVDGAGKIDPQYFIHSLASDLVEGGEDFHSAVEVELPFAGGGNTCDNADDYDEACPHNGSTAPDVVYTFEPERFGLLTADLCGSSYDTKIMLYDEKGHIVACNDDYYADDSCGMYVSKLTDIFVEEDKRYFLVVDGYGSSCGDYELAMELHCADPVCDDAECPGTGAPEGEPELGAGYDDIFNGGCGAAVPVFQEVFQTPGYDSVDFCGQTGWYVQDGRLEKDSDWLQVVAGENEIHLNAKSAHFLPLQCDVIRQQDCEILSLQTMEVGSCHGGRMSVPAHEGEVLFIRIQPLDSSPRECALLSDSYTIEISGIFGMVVSTEEVLWQSVKSYYR